MKIAVFGAGMYVTGRGGYGNGTILSSLAETSRTLPIEEVIVLAKHPENKNNVTMTASSINTRLGTRMNVTYDVISEDVQNTARMLRRERGVDCAILCVPDQFHYEYAKALLQNKLHTLVVKPLVPTLSEALDLIEIQENSGVWAAVEFHKRFDETNLFARKAIKEKKLGKLLYFDVDYSQRIVIPTELFRSWSGATNIFQYLGVHYVDLIFFLTGFLPTKVTATGTTGTLLANGINAFDSVHAIIVWQNREDKDDQFLSIFNTNWIDPVTTSAMSDQKYKIIGTNGRIELDQKNRGIELVNQNGTQQVNPYFSEFEIGPDGSSYFSGYGHRSIFQFISDIFSLQKGAVSLEHLSKNRPGFKSSLVSVAVTEAVNTCLKHPFIWQNINVNAHD